MSDYAELAVSTCFSFLRGASFPGELVQAAKALGHTAMAVTDRNTLAGVVRAHTEAKAEGLKLLIGARLAFVDGSPDILAYARDREGYARLSRLLTRGNTGKGVKKGDCILRLEDLLADTEGLLLALAPTERVDASLAPLLARMAAAAPGRVWAAAAMGYGPADARRLDRLAEMAAGAGARLLAVNDVLYHAPSGGRCRT
jgi:error-prone DNA polymerase